MIKEGINKQKMTFREGSVISGGGIIRSILWIILSSRK